MGRLRTIRKFETFSLVINSACFFMFAEGVLSDTVSIQTLYLRDHTRSVSEIGAAFILYEWLINFIIVLGAHFFFWRPKIREIEQLNSTAPFPASEMYVRHLVSAKMTGGNPVFIYFGIYAYAFIVEKIYGLLIPQEFLLSNLTIFHAGMLIGGFAGMILYLTYRQRSALQDLDQLLERFGSGSYF